MFNKDHIWVAGKQTDEILLGKFGMKTLDSRFVSPCDRENDDECLSLSRVIIITSVMRNELVVSTIAMVPNGWA